jgi:hypothetical protein
MLGAPTGDSLTYSTVEQQSLEFVRSLTPWLRRVELALSHDRDLTFDRQFVRFEIDALLRPDSAGRASFYTAARDPVTSWLDDDEVRRLEDLPPRPKPPTQQQTIEQMLARPPGGGPRMRQTTGLRPASLRSAPPAVWPSTGGESGASCPMGSRAATWVAGSR